MISSPAELRREIINEKWSSSTAGILDGYQQANFVAIPKENSFDFLLYCVRNPQVCPVLAVTEPGDPMVNAGSTSADVRHAIPRYRVWQFGELVDEPLNVSDYWTDDMVGFLLGCSHTFEGPLADAGIKTHYSSASAAPPVYVTNRPTVPAGAISGPLLVSMRAFPANQVSAAVQITAKYPTGHGSPVHVGSPETLGIADLTQPDFGPAPIVNSGETPVFWACGVTPQVVLPKLNLRTVITHYPGHMFVFDHRVSPQL